MKRLLVLVITIHFCFTSYPQGIINEDVKYTREIKRLANIKQVKTAFQLILDLEPKTIKNHVQLTEIEAPPLKKRLELLNFPKDSRKPELIKFGLTPLVMYLV